MFPARAPCAAQGALGEARLQGCPYAVWLEPRPEVPILPAVVVRVPHIGQGHDLSGEPERLERAEGLEKDRALQGRVTGLTGLVIQWEVQEDRSWWPNRKGDVPGRGHAKRRDPSLLDLAGRQSDGLVADGSDRDEEHSVHGHPPELDDDLCSTLDIAAGRVRRHKADRVIGEAANDVRGFELAKAIQWEHAIRIAIRIIVTVGVMIDAQILRSRVLGYQPVRAVVLGEERLRQSRPGRLVIGDPFEGWVFGISLPRAFAGSE